MSTTPVAPAAELDDRVAVIEAAFERHWRHFGGYPGANLRDEDGVLWFESPIRHRPYNWVVRTQIPEGLDADAVVPRVAAGFRARAGLRRTARRPPLKLDGVVHGSPDRLRRASPAAGLRDGCAIRNAPPLEVEP